ncbi:MAG: hypothetical protein SRB2_02066 [Desulfobacteraceae bacterium Eth-SRB2]|nr:MAG: hypothetical protein SRB2_02066 [Desulfobacteraceae bacterium Eth-SRB2]
MVIWLTSNPLYDKDNTKEAFLIGNLDKQLYHSGGYIMKNIPLIHCQNLNFSARLSENRIDQAQKAFGTSVVQRILCFALYLLGVNRKAVSQLLSIPLETAKSIIKTVNRHGLGALEDRRRQFSTFLPKVQPEPASITLRDEKDHVVVDLEMSATQRLKLSARTRTTPRD